MYPRIRSLREDNDFNQTMVARVLDMSQTGYSKYETGENDVSPAVLIKLAYFYDTSIEYLLGLTDSRILPERTPAQQKIYRKYRTAFHELSVKKR